MVLGPSVQKDGAVPRCFANDYWYDGIRWEPTVRYGLIDLLRPGDVAFDCGANVGGLTVPMSRIVGPKGIVCAFEASPRLIPSLQYTLVLQGCTTNTTLYQRAIYSESSRMLPFQFDSAHHHSDHISTSGKGDTAVSSLALDDFVRDTGLIPDLVKMDIEGGELDALHGFANTLATRFPHLILEADPRKLAAYEYLRALGYDCWDLAVYRRIDSAAEFPADSMLVNLAYIHSSKRNAAPYRVDMARRQVAALGSSDFAGDHGGAVSQRWLELAPGRYHFAMVFDSQDTDDDMSCGVETEERRTILTYQTNSRFLSTSYRDWIIDLAVPARVRVFFRILRKAAKPTLRIHGGTIFRLDDLSVRRPTMDANL